MKALRKALVQFRMEEGEDAQVRVGSRTLYHFWSLLSPFFKPVFLPPQRKTDGEGITWSWEQPRGENLPSSDDLKGLRRRVSDGHRQLVEALSDGPKGALTEEDIEELRARMGKIVAGLLAMPDRELMGYAANTPYGWMVHSWGAPWPGVPTFPDELVLSISGSVTSDGAPLQGAEIMLLTDEEEELTATRSDTTGRWSFSKLNPGRYLITAVAERVEFPAERVKVALDEQPVSGILIRGEARKGPPLEVLEEPPPSRPPSSSSGGVNPWKALAVVLGLLLLAGGVWWWTLENGAETTPARKVSSGAPATPVVSQTPEASTKTVKAISKVGDADVPATPGGRGKAGLATATDNSADVEGVEDGAVELGGNETKDHEHALTAKGNAGTGGAKKLAGGSGTSGKEGEKRGTPAIKPWANKRLVSAETKEHVGSNASPNSASGAQGTSKKADKKAGSGAQGAEVQGAPSEGDNPQGGEAEHAAATPEPAPSPLSNQPRPTPSPSNAKDSIQKDMTPKRPTSGPSTTRAPAAGVTPRPGGASSPNSDSDAKDTDAHEGFVGDQGKQANDSPSPEPVPGKATSASSSDVGAPRLVEPRGSAEESSEVSDDVNDAKESGQGASGAAAGSSQGRKRPAGMPAAALPQDANGAAAKPSQDAKPTPSPSALANVGARDSEAKPSPLPSSDPHWLPSVRCVQSAWKLTLVSDEILETQPVAEGDPEEGIEALRTRRLRELRAQISKTFKRAELSNGMRFSVPGDLKNQGLHWVKTEGGAGVATLTSNAGAEISWPGASALERSSWELRDGKEQAWVRVRVSADREVLLLVREGVKAWCFCGLVRAPGEDAFAERETWSDRLRWQNGADPLLPQSWVRDDDWKGGRGHRLEFPVSLTDPETPLAIRLHDTETRWCLESRFEWVTH